MSYWVVDFEASGLNKSSYPIEVGVSNGVVNYSSLIRPMSHWTSWDMNSEKVHNIPHELLLSSGNSSLSVAIELNNLLKYSIVYCDNIHWDKFWLNVLFSDNGFSPSFKLFDIKDILKLDEHWIKYEAKITELISTPQYKQHRALDDAKVIHSALTYSLSP